MTENALAKKLKLKSGLRAAIIGAPEGYIDSLRPVAEQADLSQRLDGTFDWVQIFVKTQAEVAQLFPQVVQALKPESTLWVSFPKGTSKIQTDLTRDRGWDVVQEANLKWINLISVDDTWSAFSLRPYKPGEARQSFR
jgi:hypothetical protein